MTTVECRGRGCDAYGLPNPDTDDGMNAGLEPRLSSNMPLRQDSTHHQRGQKRESSEAKDAPNAGKWSQTDHEEPAELVAGGGEVETGANSSASPPPKSMEEIRQ